MTSRPDEPCNHPPSIFLDPWLTAEGDALKQLSEGVVEAVERNFSTNMTRQARQADLLRRRLVVENLIANATSVSLSPQVDADTVLAVSTAKTKPTRYDRQDYPKRLLAGLLAALEHIGLVFRHPYVFKQRTTIVELGTNFRSALQNGGIRLEDIGRVRGAESIWLNARTGDVDFKTHAPIKQRVSYSDTHRTIGLRAEMDRINTYLTHADFCFAGQRQGPIALRRMFLLRSQQDPEAFNLSGRLFGGWWQDLKSSLRHLVTIGGEPIADLDFSSCFANLAYLRTTGRLFQGDPYDIPGLEEHRGAAKIAMLSLLSKSSDMRRLSPELKAALPDGWTARQLVDAFTRRHPDLMAYFGRDVGVELMATESQIMVALLLRIEEMGVPAMGLHDGLQVAISDRDCAMEAMQQVSERLLGVSLPVTEKPISRPQVTDFLCAA